MMISSMALWNFRIFIPDYTESHTRHINEYLNYLDIGHRFRCFYVFNLLAPELFFLILAHPVYKM